MDEADRATITRNLVELIKQVNIEQILPKLLEKGVFNPMMIERYTDTNTGLAERKRELFLNLQRRGPEAFRHLVTSLLETGHLDLVRLLKPDIDIEQYFLQTTGNFPTRDEHLNLPGMDQELANDMNPRLESLHIYNMPRSVVSLGTEPLTVQVQLAVQRKDTPTRDGPRVYWMGSRPRGLCFMINNVEYINNIADTRIGSEVDERNLKDLFEQLGFKVEPHRDQGCEDMKRKIKEFAARPEHSRYDCCVVAIMSHGRERISQMNSTITAVDGQDIDISWIVEQFSSENAPHLIRKPKIFLFQSCRGNNLNVSVQHTGGRVQFDGGPEVIRVPQMSDTLIGYSTLPGFKSNRDTYLGTWYIQAICEVFMKYAHDTDIEDMLKLVNDKVESLETEYRGRQTTIYENRGFSKLFFNPGLYDN